MSRGAAGLAERFHLAFPTSIPWRTVGREAEHPVVHPDGTGADISVLWPHLQRDGLRRVYEGELLVALEGPDYTFTAEVGRGTLEIVTAPRDDLLALNDVYERARDELLAAAEAEGLLVLGYGVQPKSGLDPDFMTPKERYGVLHEVIGDPWLWFTLTASDQVHASVARDEWVHATNVGNLLAPFIVALCANSPVVGGEDTGVVSAREQQMGTIGADGHRHGMPESPITDAEDHVARLCALPHLMMERKGRRLAGRGAFSAHAEGLDPDTAWADFLHHEHYVWHTARPRSTHGTVEIRAACQQPGPSHGASAALGLGLVAAHEALARTLDDALGDQAWGVMARWHARAIRDGLAAEEPVRGLTHRLLEDITDALARRGRGEERFTEPLWRRLGARSSPGEQIRKTFAAAGVEGVVAATRLN